MSGSDPQHHIVITGTGLVSCLGLGVEPTWQAVRAGKCGIGPSTALQSTPNPDKGYGQAPLPPGDFFPDLPREARLLRWAMDEAIREAGLTDDDGRWIGTSSPERVGLVMGTTLHGMRAAGPYFRDGQVQALSDFLAGSTARLALGDLPIRGQSVTTCAACASGLMSIGLGMALLKRGELDMVVAGGYDPVSEYAYGGFNSLRLVSESKQRPFARQRDGLKLAEGYGAVILERAESAAARSAATLGTVEACTASADAHHLSQPHPEGVGAAKAMRDALTQAGITGKDLAMITAHATATPDNDRAEVMALQRVLGDDLPDIPVAAMKSGLGHTLGAAGCVELILTLCALRDSVAPPLASVEPGDVEFESLRVVTGQAAAITGRHALVTSLGFGGSNACAIVSVPGASHDAVAASKPARPATPVRNEDREPVITGIGVVYPGAIGINALIEHFRNGAAAPREPDPAEVAALISSRRTRRMSNFVKYTLAATTLACRDGGLDSAADYPGVLGSMLGTMHGSARFSEDYYRQLVDEGVDAVNPLLFAEGVPNAGTAHLSMMLGLKGPCQTLIGSRTAGLDGLRLAASHIASGQWDAAIIGGAEEYSEMVEQTYTHCGLHAERQEKIGSEEKIGSDPIIEERGFICSAGAVTLLIESRASATRRGATIHAKLTDWHQTAWGDGTTRPPLKPAIRQVAAMLAQLAGLDHVISSANGTWIDRVEQMAVRLAGTTSGRDIEAMSIAPRLYETYSAAPLLGLALGLKAPRSTWPNHDPAAASAQTKADRLITVLASDYNGTSTVVRAEIEA